MLENVALNHIFVVCVKEIVIVTVIAQEILYVCKEMEMKLFKDALDKEEAGIFMVKIFVPKLGNV